MSSILEARLKEFPWRKKRLTYEYSIPDDILELETPMVFYPAAGRDISLVEKLQGTNATVVYQDIIYGSDAILLDSSYMQSPDEAEQTVAFIEQLESQGIGTISCALTADTLDEKADLVLLRGVFGFLFQNDFSELILANCKDNALIIGYRFDLDVMCLLYDGLERVDAEHIRVHEYAHSELYEHLTRFPELGFYALKGSIRTFGTEKIGQEKFEKRGRALVENELENAMPYEIEQFIEALPPKTYPKYLRVFLEGKKYI